MQETIETRSPASESFSSRRLGRRTASLRRHMFTPSREERFEIVAGTLGLRVGGEEIVAVPGERLTIPAGTPH